MFTGLAAVCGKLSDIFNIRNLLLISMIIFGVGSLACGFATTGFEMILARVFQGIGAAVIFLVSLAMITLVFPPQQRGLALGIYSAVGTFFLGIGPLVGGFLIDILSWRWIFWINLPVMAVISIIVAWQWKAVKRVEHPPVFDFLGTLTLATGLSLIIFVLMQGPEWGWSNLWIITLASTGLLIIVF